MALFAASTNFRLFALLFFSVLGEKRCPQLLASKKGASGGVNDQSVSRSIVILGGNERFNFVKDGRISPKQGLLTDKRRSQLRPL